MIGLLMLIGIVVTNAIVLIDLINQKRKAGASVEESIRQGARLRVRPIVMTALATIFALIPMGLGLTGGGVFISKPLAIVVIGGLVSSTLLTLILVPVLYDLLETWREKREHRKSERAAARKAAAKPPPQRQHLIAPTCAPISDQTTVQNGARQREHGAGWPGQPPGSQRSCHLSRRPGRGYATTWRQPNRRVTTPTSWWSLSRSMSSSAVWPRW